MDIRQMYKTNKDKETEGTFVEIGGGVSVKIKRAGARNKAFAFAQSKMLKPLQRQIRSGTVSPDVMEDINISLFANHVVTDWKGITEDGKAIPFSKEKFVEYAKEMPDFFDEIFIAAYEVNNFKDEEEAELVKKPEASTDTD